MEINHKKQESVTNGIFFEVVDASHHSKLEGGRGDAVIIGASSVLCIILKATSRIWRKEESQEVVNALDASWERCKGVASNYFH